MNIDRRDLVPPGLQHIFGLTLNKCFALTCKSWNCTGSPPGLDSAEATRTPVWQSEVLNIEHVRHSDWMAIGRQCKQEQITWKYPPPSKRNLGKATKIKYPVHSITIAIDFGDALYALANASRSSTHDSTKWHLFRKVHKTHARPNHPNHSHVSVNVRQTLKVIVAITLHILHTSKQIILTKQTRKSNLSNWKL